MFIISITYKVDIEIIEQYLDSHIKFLDKYYDLEKFLLSGRKNPRTGGIIIADNISYSEIREIIKEDSFYINNIADYEIIEFVPTKLKNLKI